MLSMYPVLLLLTEAFATMPGDHERRLIARYPGYNNNNTGNLKNRHPQRALSWNLASRSIQALHPLLWQGSLGWRYCVSIKLRKIANDELKAPIQQNVQPAQHLPKLSKGASAAWSVAILAIGIALMMLFFHLDRHNQISDAIRSSGAFGIILSILLMALFCVIPVPSEFLMIMNMKVFGVWWGIFYTWIGAMLGALTVFWFARYFGRHLLEAFVSADRLQQVNMWIVNRGPIGLLLVRLIPLPFIVVNYAAGVLKSVKPFDYVWTTAVGLLPYDLGAALLFLGVSTRFRYYLVIGALVVATIWIGGFLYNRYVNKAQRWAH